MKICIPTISVNSAILELLGHKRGDFP